MYGFEVRGRRRSHSPPVGTAVAGGRSQNHSRIISDSSVLLSFASTLWMRGLEKDSRKSPGRGGEWKSRRDSSYMGHETHRRFLRFDAYVLSPLLRAGPAPAQAKKGRFPDAHAQEPAFAPARPSQALHLFRVGRLSPLSVSGVRRAKSLALIMDDPDAPPGTWCTGSCTTCLRARRSSEQGSPRTKLFPMAPGTGSAGAWMPSPRGLSWSLSSAGQAHRYYFRLFALDAVLGLPPRAAAPALRKAMAGHILAETELMGKFGR